MKEHFRKKDFSKNYSSASSNVQTRMVILRNPLIITGVAIKNALVLWYKAKATAGNDKKANYEQN